MKLGSAWAVLLPSLPLLVWCCLLSFFWAFLCYFCCAVLSSSIFPLEWCCFSLFPFRWCCSPSFFAVVLLSPTPLGGVVFFVLLWVVLRSSISLCGRFCFEWSYVPSLFGCGAFLLRWCCFSRPFFIGGAALPLVWWCFSLPLSFLGGVAGLPLPLGR